MVVVVVVVVEEEEVALFALNNRTLYNRS